METKTTFNLRAGGGITDTGTLEVSNGGITKTVTSYILYTDGSKSALFPQVDSSPNWCDVLITDNGDYTYGVKVTAQKNTGEARVESLYLSQGVVEGKSLQLVIRQGVAITDTDITPNLS